MSKLGIFFTCFDELEATRFSLNILKNIYPDIKIRLFYESDINFKFLESEISDLKCSQEEDTMSGYLNIEYHDYLSDKDQAAIKKAALAVVHRLFEAIEYLDSEYILMMDPDAIVRGDLAIPENSGLLGCRINTHIWALEKLNETLLKYGGKKITAWGATPAIFNVKDFLIGSQILLNTPNLLDDLCKSFYWFCAHDILLASIFSLIGKEEEFNPELLQCTSVQDWRQLNHPLLHQFREYYPLRKTKYKINEQKESIDN
jgi:hypothetical protein